MKESSKQLQVVRHSPTLNTVMMVEKVLRESGQVVSVAELKRRLPKKVMHSTLQQILEYLLVSGKILITTKGVLWIFKERNVLDTMIKEGLEI